MMTKKEWLIWLITVLLIVLVATLPITMRLPGGFSPMRMTLFKWIERFWTILFYKF